MIVAKLAWRRYFAGKKNITFIDNEPAKFCLIKGDSPVTDSLDMACDSWCFDAKEDVASWYTRVHI